MSPKLSSVDSTIPAQLPVFSEEQTLSLDRFPQSPGAPCSAQHGGLISATLSVTDKMSKSFHSLLSTQAAV